MRRVGWKVAEAEFRIQHCEHGWAKVFLVGVGGVVKVSGAPARVDEFPTDCVGEVDGAPGVVWIERWDWCTGGYSFVTEAFSVAGNDDAFEACGYCEGGEETSVTFADCEAAGDCGGWSGGVQFV